MYKYILVLTVIANLLVLPNAYAEQHHYKLYIPEGYEPEAVDTENPNLSEKKKKKKFKYDVYIEIDHSGVGYLVGTYYANNRKEALRQARADY